MRRIVLPILALIVVASLSACQSTPTQVVQTVVHPCQTEYYSDLMWSPDSKQLAYLFSGAQSGVRIVNTETRRTSEIVIPGQQGSLVSWWPDGSRVIYFGPAGFEIIMTDGSFGGQPGPFGENPYAVTVSPDGEQVASINFENGIYELRIGESSSGRLVSIFQEAQAGSIKWSPDGEHIAFKRLPAGGLEKLIIVGADGANPVEVPDYVTGRWAWSPDGKYIAYEHELPGSIVTLRVVGLDHTDSVQVAYHVTGRWVWSPNGKRIAFLTGSVLDLVNVDGSDPVTLAAMSGSDFVWLPDGNGLIVPMSWISPEPDKIAKVGLDGTRTILASLSASDLAFSPDASKITYASEFPYPELYVMNVDGTDKVQLTRNPGKRMCFDWPF